VKVREIMSSPVVQASAELPVPDLAALLDRHRISAVPITDQDGTVIGLVSQYDLLSRTGQTARDVMSPGIISVSEDTDVEEVRFLLIERRIRRVPVMRGQELVGIVSRSDIVRLLALDWICQVCGLASRGERPPERCPTCGAAAERFEQQPREPGM
jgi:CBS domain-containing protein